MACAGPSMLMARSAGDPLKCLARKHAFATPSLLCTATVGHGSSMPGATYLPLWLMELYLTMNASLPPATNFTSPACMRSKVASTSGFLRPNMLAPSSCKSSTSRTGRHLARASNKLGGGLLGMGGRRENDGQPAGGEKSRRTGGGRCRPRSPPNRGCGGRTDSLRPRKCDPPTGGNARRDGRHRAPTRGRWCGACVCRCPRSLSPVDSIRHDRPMPRRLSPRAAPHVMNSLTFSIWM